MWIIVQHYSKSVCNHKLTREHICLNVFSAGGGSVVEYQPLTIVELHSAIHYPALPQYFYYSSDLSVIACDAPSVKQQRIAAVVLECAFGEGYSTDGQYRSKVVEWYLVCFKSCDAHDVFILQRGVYTV